MGEKQRKVSEYLAQLHKDWQYKQPRGKGSQTMFAVYLGIQATTLSNIVNEVRLPSRDIMDKIAAKYGPEIYYIMEVPARMPHDPELIRVNSTWHSLTVEDKEGINEIINNREEAQKASLDKG